MLSCSWLGLTTFRVRYSLSFLPLVHLLLSILLVSSSSLTSPPSSPYLALVFIILLGGFCMTLCICPPSTSLLSWPIILPCLLLLPISTSTARLRSPLQASSARVTLFLSHPVTLQMVVMFSSDIVIPTTQIQRNYYILHKYYGRATNIRFTRDSSVSSLVEVNQANVSL